MIQKKCNNCGFVTTKEQKFCPECGTELTVTASDNTIGFESNVINKLDELTAITSNISSSMNCTPDDNATINYDASSGENSAEKILTVVAYIVLFVGIIGGLIEGYIFSGMWISRNASEQQVLIFICVAAAGCLLAVLLWASLMLYVNISTNIRHIKHIKALESKINVTL